MFSMLQVVLALLCFKCVTATFILDGITVSTPSECIRECIANTPPKTCYYNFTLEYYSVLGRACEICTPNQSNKFTSSCQCVLTDGVEKSILTANRQMPGPSIQVCKGDTVVVDVINHIEGMGVTIHFHGVWQTRTPWADGVPFLTQCPTVEGDTFRHIFKADNEGTHFWHSHTGPQKLDGLCGTLVIREPKSVDLSRLHYDYDLPDHVIIINDWLHEPAATRFPGRLSYNAGQTPDSILINGKGRSINPFTRCETITPYEVFKVAAGKRYRFRLINAFATVCPAQFNIQSHQLKIIATDGIAVQPVIVDTIISFSGERIDFVVEANQAGSFWIQVRGLGECGIARIQQLAVLTYSTLTSLEPSSPVPTWDFGLPLGKVFNPLDYTYCEPASNRGICYHQLRSVVDIQGSVDQTPDVRLFLPFTLDSFDSQTYYAPGVYQAAIHTPDAYIISSNIAGINFQFPPSPLLTQRKDIDPQTICTPAKKPASCQPGQTCHCTYLQVVKLNGTTEMIIYDALANPNISHPFHLHGGIFKVVGAGTFPVQPGSQVTQQQVDQWEKNGLLKRNLQKPPGKDTIAVPYNGYVILRSRFINPGYWLMHCHFMYHLMIGMSMTFQVGTETEIAQSASIPANFPKCGNFKPPLNTIVGKI